MGLLSLLHKNKQKDTASGNGEFYSRAEEDSKAVRSRGKRKQSSQGAEQADPVLPQKKRARRRLVGAIALVLAAVIGLPMILDSEPKPLADDITIQIPSKNKPVSASASSDQPTPAASSKVAASASLDQKEEMVKTTPPAETPVVPPVSSVAPAVPKDESKKEALTTPTSEKSSDNTAVAAKKDTKSETKPEHVQTNKGPAKPVAQNTSKADDSARAMALLDGKADSKPVNNKKASKFVIQVAALASKEKIDELQAKLRHAGIHSYTEKIHTGSGERTRIRVGPFADKEEAEKSQAKLVKLGLSGAVVPVGN